METITAPSIGSRKRAPHRLLFFCVALLGLPALLIVAAAAFPAQARLHFETWQGERRLAAREYGAAVRHFRAAAESAPYDGASYRRVAAAFWAQGQTEQAESAWRAALAREHGDDEALVGLGRVALARDDYDGALRLFQSALARRPGSLAARMGLADALLGRGDLAAARQEWNRVLASTGLTPEQQRLARFGLALSLAEDAPEESLGMLAQVNPGDALTGPGALPSGVEPPAATPDEGAYRAVALGHAFLLAGRLVPARAQLERAVAIQPDYGDALASLGYVRWREGALEEALALLRRATEAAPGSVLPRYFAGITLRGERRFEEALVELEEAMRLDPQNPALVRELARTLVAAADYAAAGDAYEHAVRLAPDSADLIQEAAAFYLEHLFRLDRGLIHAKSAANLAPGRAAAHDALGWALYLNGEDAGAARALRQALAIDPAFAGAHYHLAVLLEHNGDPAAARDAYERVLDLDTGRLAERAQAALDRR